MDGSSTAPDAGGGGGGLTIQRGLFVNGPDRTGPIEWIPVDESGLGSRVTLAAEIPEETRRSTWGFSEDGEWLFYTVGQDPDESVWTRRLDESPQRLDDGSKPHWGSVIPTGDRVFFVGASEVAYAASLGPDGGAGEPVRISPEGKRLFAAIPSPSGDYVGMHYYGPQGSQEPILRAVQSMENLGEDLATCCGFDYYWNLTPEWAHGADRELFVAGPSYDDRDLYVAGAEATAPTPVHLTDDHGGRRVVEGDWSPDDQLISYLVKDSIENFSNHLWVADVSGEPERLEATTAHTAGVRWRPGSGSRQLTYNEYPAPESQERLMLATVSTDPLAVDTTPLVEHEPSDIFAISYAWNADGTALLHHGGASGEYTVTFVGPDGGTKDVPLGIYFREEDEENDWLVPHLSWSEDGRWFICRTNTGYSIASIRVEEAEVTPIIDLPGDVDFAWWDRRAVRQP